MNNHRSAIVYHPTFLDYDFGPQHPLRPERITAGLDLLETAGLWDREAETLLAPPPEIADLALVHDPAYIRAVQDAGIGMAARDALVRHGLTPGDNPAFPNMHEPAALVASGCVAAARRIMAGALDHAFHPAGGLHHAMRDRASGFCVYNDPAVAAAVVLRETDARVMYIDFDCHHGDGVQWLFYDNARVLTLSIHESGRFLFPGTGFVNEVGEGEGRGLSANVPVLPFTQDASWLDAVNAIVPALALRFQPDFLISSHGADTHDWDPLTHVSLTTRSFVHQVKLMHELAHFHTQGRWLAVGSGGYDWRRVVPRSWALVWAEMTGRQLDHDLPDSWRERWGDGSASMPEAYLDPEGTVQQTGREREIARANYETIKQLRELLSL